MDQLPLFDDVPYKGTMTPEELPYWLVLNRCYGVGGKTIARLLADGKSLSSWFRANQATQALTTLLVPQGQARITLDWRGVERDLLSADLLPACLIENRVHGQIVDAAVVLEKTGKKQLVLHGHHHRQVTDQSSPVKTVGDHFTGIF